MAVLSALMLIVTQVIGVVQRTWARSNSKISEFREARSALDVLSRSISQATLNAYWQNNSEIVRKDIAGQNVTRAKSYLRVSELQFVSGQATNLIPKASADDHPGHALFFQAPLGVTNFASTASSAPGLGPGNTENMVNLLCGRGYFVEWGDDKAFRPTFLNSIGTVHERLRYRLMEYSPTAEKNRIYDSTLRPIVDPTDPNKNFSKKWYVDDVTGASSEAVAGETTTTRAFVRPVADNVICFVVSPQVNRASASSTPPPPIAPRYEYDSLLITNPGVTPSADSPQGTQHLLPPLVKITLVVVDTAAAEQLSEKGSSSLRAQLAAQLSGKFVDATNFDAPNSAYHTDLSNLEAFLIKMRLNYRIFATTVIIKQARWST